MEIVERRYPIQVKTKGETVVQKIELDKNAKVIKGLLITSERDDLVYARGTQKVEINGRECWEENYESKMLLSTMNVDVNKRYKNMHDRDPGNGIIVFSYTDNPHPLFAFAPYTVSLYVEYEI